MKKGAALFIVLLVIVAVGTIGVTLSRSVISGVAATSAISDSIIAEQASKAGLEAGLLKCKLDNNCNTSGGTIIRINLETMNIQTKGENSPVAANEIVADVTISGAPGNKKIESTGRFGRAFKTNCLGEAAACNP